MERTIEQILSDEMLKKLTAVALAYHADAYMYEALVAFHEGDHTLALGKLLRASECMKVEDARKIVAESDARWNKALDEIAQIAGLEKADGGENNA